MRVKQCCPVFLIAVICVMVGETNAQTVYLNPGEEKEVGFNLEPEESVNVTVEIKEIAQWKFLSSSGSAPWGDKPTYLIWTGGGSGRKYNYSVANTHWIEAWTRVKVDAKWSRRVEPGEGEGEAEEEIITGWVILRAESKAGSFHVMAETNVICVGNSVNLHAYMEKADGQQKAAEADWNVSENGIIPGNTRGTSVTVQGTNSGNMTVTGTLVADSSMSDSEKITVVKVSQVAMTVTSGTALTTAQQQDFEAMIVYLQTVLSRLDSASEVYQFNVVGDVSVDPALDTNFDSTSTDMSQFAANTIYIVGDINDRGSAGLAGEGTGILININFLGARPALAHEMGHVAGYSGGDMDGGVHSSDSENIMYGKKWFFWPSADEAILDDNYQASVKALIASE